MAPHVSDRLRDFFGPGALVSFLLASGTALLGLGLPVGWRLRHVLRSAQRDERAQADGILVLGRTLEGEQITEVFRARLEHGARLWHSGLAPRVIVAGGLTGTATRTEAEAGGEHLVALGVPRAHIHLEGESKHTLGNLFNVRLAARDASWRRLIIVSDPLHLARIAAYASGFGLDVLLSPARESPPARGTLGWWSRAVTEAFMVHWYHVGVTYSRAIRSRRLLDRVT